MLLLFFEGGVPYKLIDFDCIPADLRAIELGSGITKGVSDVQYHQYA